MSKLADLLNAKQPMFDLSIRQLETATGKNGRDVALATEIHQKVVDRMRRLGLDPGNITGLEFYRALENRIEEDNKRVTKLIGGKDHSDVRHIVPSIVKAAEETKTPKTCWVLKRSVAKDMLREMPPKQMMKHLNYRSVNSLLKRENFDEMYTALRFSEGDEWLNQYNELFKKVKPSDFEEREIKIIIMDHDKWVDLAGKFTKKKLHNITHTKELGVIVVVPMHVDRMPGITLKSLPLIYHYINEIRLYSSFFKLKSTVKNFGAEIVDTLIADPSDAAVLAGHNIHWRVIQRYFGKLKSEAHPEAFEPHVHPEDLHWRKAEELLIQLDPEMEFWKDLDYVGMMFDGKPVSLNLMDVSFSYSNNETYNNRNFYHMRESLWNEVFMRYMGEDTLKQQILEQLDNDMIAPETLGTNKTKKRGVTMQEPASSTGGYR